MTDMDEVLAHAMLPLLDARLVPYQHFLQLVLWKPWLLRQKGAAARHRKLRGSPLPIRHMRAAPPTWHHLDCEEKRGPDE
jgi:hypothetical protein